MMIIEHRGLNLIIIGLATSYHAYNIQLLLMTALLAFRIRELMTWEIFYTSTYVEDLSAVARPPG